MPFTQAFESGVPGENIIDDPAVFLRNQGAGDIGQITSWPQESRGRIEYRGLHFREKTD